MDVPLQRGRSLVQSYRCVAALCCSPARSPAPAPAPGGGAAAGAAGGGGPQSNLRTIFVELRLLLASFSCSRDDPLLDSIILLGTLSCIPCLGLRVSMFSLLDEMSLVGSFEPLQKKR